MQRKDKERVVAELTERLRQSQSLILADYRGLSVSEVDELRTKLLETGATFSIVKNTLTRLAAEAAGTEELLQYLEGPNAIAFIQEDGDPAAVAKVLSETARATRVLVVKGGLLDGRPVADTEVEELAKLPPLDVLRGQVLGAVVAPLNAIAGLVNAPLQDLHGLIDARIEQLGGESAAEAPAEAAGDGEVAGDDTAAVMEEATSEQEEPTATDEPAGADGEEE